MSTKFLLPVLAMIFAVGMSFTTLDKASDPNSDYILIEGSFEPLNMELNCGDGTVQCRVRLQDGSEHDVYDAPNPNKPKVGIGQVIIL